MQIPAKRVKIDWDRRWDRFSSKFKKPIRLEYIYSYFNEAQEIYFENRVDIAEINSAVRQDLRLFEKKKIELKSLKKGKECDIFEFPEDMFRKLRHSALVSKKGCGSKVIPIIMYQMDDLDFGRKSPFWRSSYEWEHILGDEGEDGFYLWHEGEFKVDKVFIDYYRKPIEVHGPSMTDKKEYIDWNGIKRTSDSNCEFSNTFQFRKIINIMIYLARVDNGDIRESQMALNKILDEEKFNT